jgi:methionyl-tRNA synthetase
MLKKDNSPLRHGGRREKKIDNLRYLCVSAVNIGSDSSINVSDFEIRISKLKNKHGVLSHDNSKLPACPWIGVITRSS